MYKILFVGPMKHGSNANGLAKSFRRLGNVVQVVDPEGTILTLARAKFGLRGMRRIIRPILIRHFSEQIIHEAKLLRPHLAVIFKGNYVKPEVIAELKKLSVFVVNFYPDVSFMCHGRLLPMSLPLYDYIFTTKSFGPADLEQNLGYDINKTMFVPHGYDPDVHRKICVAEKDKKTFACDASFIGTWSRKKEYFLKGLAEDLAGNFRLRIWGYQWQRGINGTIEDSIEGTGVEGDLYALAIQCSKINIAILSETRHGASSGDKITSRTFHIPASGGFMLHERTDELAQFYDEGIEMACFSSPEELSEKVQYYLKHEKEREKIRIAGHKRCVAEYSLDKRAKLILKEIESVVSRYRDT